MIYFLIIHMFVDFELYIPSVFGRYRIDACLNAENIGVRSIRCLSFSRSEVGQSRRLLVSGASYTFPDGNFFLNYCGLYLHFIFIDFLSPLLTSVSAASAIFQLINLC